MPERQQTPRCFRGWWVLLGCILIRLASAPGHSYCVVAFVDSFITTLHTDRLQISYVWLVASCAATVFTPFAGAGVDFLGVRLFCCLIAPLLLISVYTLAWVQNAMQLAISLTAIRVLGPECLVLASGVTYQRWFVKRRGRAAAIFGINGYILKALPALMTALIERLGWQEALHTLAFTLLALLSVGTVLTYDSPEAVGLLPDGGPSTVPSAGASWHELDHLAEADSPETTPAHNAPLGKVASCSTADEIVGTDHTTSSVAAAAELGNASPLAAATLRAAMRHPLLWCLAFMDSIRCIFSTGFTLTALGVVAARSDELSRLGALRAARDVFLPLSIMQNGCTSLFSLFVIDRLSSRRRALATAWAAGVVALVEAAILTVRTEAGLLAWTITYGVATGFYFAVMEIIHATLFGPVALGRVTGFQRAFGTLSTGVGPVVFAASHDLLAGGSYDPGIALVAALLGASAAATGLVAWWSVPPSTSPVLGHHHLV